MNWFKNLKTRTKLLASFALMSAMMAVVGIVGLRSVAKLDDEMETLYSHHMIGVMNVLEAQARMLSVGKGARQALIEPDHTVVRDLQAKMEVDLKEMQASLEDAAKTLVTAEAKEQMRVLRDEKVGPWAESNRKVVELALANRDAEGVAELKSAGRQANELEAEMEKLHESKVALGGAAVKQSHADYVAVRATLIGVLVLAIAFAIGIGFLISSLIAKPLQEAGEVLGQVAEGDFTRTLEVKTRDEVGQLAGALNRTVHSMRDALLGVGQSARSVASASQQLTGAAQGISSGAQEQASSLEETAASLEEMTSTVKQNADNAQQAAQLAQGARDVAEKGGHVVGSAVDAMKEINDASRKIADIITTIDEIAFQTNLLALNAAVEAARAGEQGRGFAVVAGEVRNLAQRSATAAKEIKGLIQDTVDKVEAGSRLVNQSGQTLDEIVVSVKKVTDLIGEIAAASREQSTGIDQVNTAVTQMDSVTQSNASQTEELAGTSEALAAQAQQMMALVERFRLGEGEGGPAGSAVAPVVSRHAAPAAGRAKPRLKAIAGGRKAGPAPVAPAKTGTHDDFEEF